LIPFKPLVNFQNPQKGAIEMLDIKLLRAEPEKVKERLATRNGNYAENIDEILAIDIRRRQISTATDELKARQNADSKKIPQMKKNGEDTAEIMAEMKQIAEEIKQRDAEISDLEAKQKLLLLSTPNLPSETTPVGKDDNDNVVVRTWGEVRKFDFEPLPHWDIGKNLGLLDPESAAKVTGTRFHFLRGAVAKLERAIVSFFLDTHAESGYTEIFPPYIVNRASMTATGQLPKFEEDAFCLTGGEFFLCPTAEVPVTNIHRDEIINSENLPIKYCAYSACFRAEAGSAGRDQRGLIRQHQFNKVELVKFSSPETSYEELESLTKDAEKVLQLLELPYRVSALCSGDIGFSSAKTYDIEVWMPSYNRYVEISSCSNFESYQARRGDIKFRKDHSEKPQFVHTLNGSGVAVGRTVAAILENFQNADGSVSIPKVLQKYIGFDKICKENL
jgi:seryl-tRNA synthetase